MTENEFNKVVEDALDELPDDFREKLDNIEIVVEDTPPPDIARGRILLGLYQGIPLRRRTHYYGIGGTLPDKITLFKNNIERIGKDPATVKEQIKRTLLHEIGHYFGISDRRLRELGY